MASRDSKSNSGLRVEHVFKSLGGQPILSDVSLQMPISGTCALIGPSGCGKTTLLKLMIGLYWPDSGTISLNGAAFTSENVQRLRQNIGYVIQSGGLFPHLSARENIGLMARYLKWPKSQFDTRIDELLTLTQFPANALERYPAQLSGGQKQRVGLMRALLLDPDYLLLDEPLAALDPMVRADMQRQLKQIFRQLGKTVVLVTHDLHEAAYFADQVVLLNQGRVEQRGTTRELIDDPATDFVASFVQTQSFLAGSRS